MTVQPSAGTGASHARQRARRVREVPARASGRRCERVCRLRRWTRSRVTYISAVASSAGHVFAVLAAHGLPRSVAAAPEHSSRRVHGVEQCAWLYVYQCDCL